MCGIFGFIVTKQLPPSVIKKSVNSLFLLSETRGKEASGVVFSMGGVTQILKTPTKGSVFIKSPEFKNLLKLASSPKQKDFPLAIIGHSRLTTNGTHSNNLNNQPVINDSGIIVHNGIILNTPKLWKENPDLSKHTGVDTEIILALYCKFRKQNISPITAIGRTYHNIQGAATIAVLESNHPYLLLATNTGSLYYIQGENWTLFTSEKYILKTIISSLFQLGNSKTSEIINCRAGEGILINIVNNTKKLFNLSTKRLNNSTQTILSRPVIEIKSKNTPIFTSTILNSLSKLKTHSPDFKKVSHIKRCTKCIMPETMPMIRFDKNGVCNFCKTYAKANPKGTQALESFVSQYRSKDGSPDCIVALSGGRDSSYGLHYAKKILGLHPIAYTYDWGMVTDTARRNQSRMTAALGVEHIVISADIQKKRNNIHKNINAWLNKPDLGMVTLLTAGDKQAEYYAEKLKQKTGIKLVLYCRGNQLEDERFKFGYYNIFDGTPQGVVHNLSFGGKLKMLAYYCRQFLINPKYINSSLVDSALAYASIYMLPHDFFYLWHYLPWNEKEIITTLKNTYGWETPSDTVATWRIDDGTPPFYNYIYYHVQGFTEHDGLRSNQIREGVMKRSEALSLVELENLPRYEALKWYFDSVGVDGHMVLSQIDALPTLY